MIQISPVITQHEVVELIKLLHDARHIVICGIFPKERR